MAGQKPARQGSGSGRQSAAGARRGSGGNRQGAAGGRSGGGRQGPATAGKAAANPVVNSGQAGAKGTSRSAGNPRSAGNGAASAGMAAGRQGASRSGSPGAASVGRVPSTSPVGRLLDAVWSPFRSMGGLPLATFILSLYGFGASVYLTIAHYDTSVTLACSDKGLINCQEVTTSPESIVFGIFPVAVLGLAFYIFMVAVNSPWGWRLRQPWIGWARVGSVVVGMCFVLYLIYAEVIEIGAICLWCTSVHVATFLIFALIVFHTSFSWGKPVTTGRG